MDERTGKELEQFDRELIEWIDKADPNLLHKLVTTPIKGSSEIFTGSEEE